MKKMQRWLPALVAGAALAGLASQSQAASPIIYNFASDQQSWFETGPTNNTPVTWNATQGTSGGGCLQFSITPTNMESDPGVDLTIATAEYMSVSFDLKLDPASGTTASGNYGNVQVVFRNSYLTNWDSFGWTYVYNADVNNVYKHYSFNIPRFGGVYANEARMIIQLTGNGAAYSGAVTGYLDNVTISTVPNPWVIDDFSTDTSATYPWSTWSTSGTNQYTTAVGGGALQLTANWPVNSSNNWYQTWFGHEPSGFSMDPSRWTFLECDVMVDAANSTINPTNYRYCDLAYNVRNSSWGDNPTTPANTTLDDTYTNGFKHVKVALPYITGSVGFDIILRGNAFGPQRVYIDNIQLSSPIARPPIKALAKNTEPGGVKITANGPGDPNEREALCQPALWSSTNNMFWKGLTPATYSMTFSNWPNPTTAPNFEAHLFLVNRDTIDSPDWNETYGACDWNAKDVIALRVANQTNLVTPGLIVSLQWKTNSPGSGLPNVYAVELPMTSANGTWKLQFTSDTDGSIIAPDNSVVTNFTMPSFNLDPNYFANFEPAASFVQFGLFKNNGDLDNGSNNFKGFTLTHVHVENGNGVYFDDSFIGSMTNTYAWRVTSQQQVTYTPYNTAYWLQWTVPDGGFTQQSATNVAGPWADAGITYITTDFTGTNRFGAVPSSAMPAGPNAFFRLMKP